MKEQKECLPLSPVVIPYNDAGEIVTLEFYIGLNSYLDLFVFCKIFCGLCMNIDKGTLRAVGFSYAKRERNHCEKPSAFPLSMCELVTPHVMHLMPSSFVNNFFFWKCLGTKESKCISPKALTKNNSILTVLLFTSYHSMKMTPLF